MKIAHGVEAVAFRGGHGSSGLGSHAGDHGQWSHPDSARIPPVHCGPSLVDRSRFIQCAGGFSSVPSGCWHGHVLGLTALS